jgi:hypothetical protein
VAPPDSLWKYSIVVAVVLLSVSMVNVSGLSVMSKITLVKKVFEYRKAPTAALIQSDGPHICCAAAKFNER